MSANKNKNVEVNLGDFKGLNKIEDNYEEG